MLVGAHPQRERKLSLFFSINPSLLIKLITMNTHEIIQVLDAACIILTSKISRLDPNSMDYVSETLFLQGKLKAYEDLLEHIHLGIEKELNALENQTRE